MLADCKRSYLIDALFREADLEQIAQLVRDRRVRDAEERAG